MICNRPSVKREARKEKRKCVSLGHILIIFVRKYRFFSLFTLLYSLACRILRQAPFGYWTSTIRISSSL